jgi:hypothetical protein
MKILYISKGHNFPSYDCFNQVPHKYGAKILRHHMQKFLHPQGSHPWGGFQQKIVSRSHASAILSQSSHNLISYTQFLNSHNYMRRKGKTFIFSLGVLGWCQYIRPMKKNN